MLRTEKGITLVALIITIIVLVILAAVSIAAVYNSRVVDYAVNGAINFSTESMNENNILSGTESLLDSTLVRINSILQGTQSTSTPAST